MCLFSRIEPQFYVCQYKIVGKNVWTYQLSLSIYQLLYTMNNILLRLSVIIYLQVVQHEEFLTLTAAQVAQLIRSDKLSVQTEEQVKIKIK